MISPSAETLNEDIGAVLERARAVALDYFRLTGKPLGITGEIGEYEAARLLGLHLAPAREPGYDAVDREGRRFQIKTRRLTDLGSRRSQTVGGIDLKQPWEAVLLVLLNAEFQAVNIWEATRHDVQTALQAPGSKARNERGALSINKFKSIARLIWRR